MRILAAAVLYFLLVFGMGVVLGPIRVLWLEPRLGTTAAVLCEAPVLLLTMIFAARFVRHWLRLPAEIMALAEVGLGALALVVIADVIVGIFARGITWADQLAYLSSAAGRIYLLLLCAFAAMPLLVMGRLAKPD